MLRTFSPKSETAGAIRFVLSRSCALTRYVDGTLEIDNSAAEKALRAVALGRKNYLFAGSDADGERAAAFYSLIGSAKLNGLDSELHLRTVLGADRRPSGQPARGSRSRCGCPSIRAGLNPQAIRDEIIRIPVALVMLRKSSFRPTGFGLRSSSHRR